MHQNMMGGLNGLIQLTNSMRPSLHDCKHEDMQNTIKAQLDHLRIMEENDLDTSDVLEHIKKC